MLNHLLCFLLTQYKKKKKCQSPLVCGEVVKSPDMLYLVCVHVKNSLLSSLVTKSELKGMGVSTITPFKGGFAQYRFRCSFRSEHFLAIQDTNFIISARLIPEAESS